MLDSHESTEIAVMLGSKVCLSELDELSQLVRVALDMHVDSSICRADVVPRWTDGKCRFKCRGRQTHEYDTRYGLRYSFDAAVSSSQQLAGRLMRLSRLCGIACVGVFRGQFG